MHHSIDLFGILIGAVIFGFIIMILFMLKRSKISDVPDKSLPVDGPDDQLEKFSAILTKIPLLLTSARRVTLSYWDKDTVNGLGNLIGMDTTLTGTEVLIKLGNCRYLLGDYSGALSCWLAAKQQASLTDDRPMIDVCYFNIGQLYHERGTPLSRSETGIDYRPDKSNPVATGDIVDLHINDAVVSISRSDIDKALSCREEDLTEQRDILCARIRATALSNMGSLYGNHGDIDKAFDRYREALSAHRQIDDAVGTAADLENIGFIHEDRKEMDKALGCYEEALALYRTIGDKQGSTRSLEYIGLIRFGRDEADAALTCYEEALGIRRECGDWQEEAEDLEQIGLLHNHNGDSDRALASLTDALDIVNDHGFVSAKEKITREIAGIRGGGGMPDAWPEDKQE